MSNTDHRAIAPSPRFVDRASDAFARLLALAPSAGPPLLFGLRLWAAVCLALYVVFWLELDSPFWAGTTAAIVCQPSLGASLRKASFRVIGTLIGAVAIVLLTVSFPQSRVGFLLGLAIWGALCGLVASILKNFASYAAALAGYTAALVAIDQLGATGGAHGDVLLLAINRGTEICIGIVCAGVVLAGTDFGHARRRVAATFGRITAAVSSGFCRTFAVRGPELLRLRLERRELIRNVATLGPAIDEAIGESTELRYRTRALQAAVDGLFSALTGWRTVANHLEHASDQNQRDIDEVAARLPGELRAISPAANPIALCQICRTAARELFVMRCTSPSEQLMADHSAKAMTGLAAAFDGLALLTNPRGPAPRSRVARVRVPDWLPSIVNAVRILFTLVAVELFWIWTAWPNGAFAIAFAAITVILLAPIQDEAAAAAQTFLYGCALAMVLAAIIGFAVLPKLATFLGFALALGAVLVPIGALSAQPWNGQLFTITGINFIPMLAPENLETYDTSRFYNSSVAIFVGVLFAVLAFRLIPPPSPALRTRRLLALTLRDLRRLVTHRKSVGRSEWQNRIFGRLSVMPPQAELVQGAQLAAALSVGSEAIILRRIAGRAGLGEQTRAAFAALAHGDSQLAIARLASVDRTLAAIPERQPGARARLRARGSILAITDALAQYADYFDGRAA
jgi:uncharacterized membrane protein YccC